MPAPPEAGRTVIQALSFDGPLIAEMIKYKVPLKEARRIVTNALAVRYLQEAHGNVCLAAELAGMHRNSFTRQIPADLRAALRFEHASKREKAKERTRSRNEKGRYVRNESDTPAAR